MKFSCAMSFFVSQDIESEAFGTQLLTALEGTAFWPIRVGRSEPLRQKADGLSKSDLVSRWPFMWKSNISYGNYFVTPPRGLAQFTIRARAPLTAFAELFRRCTNAIRPEYAVATALTPDVVARGLEQTTVYLHGPFHGPKREPIFSLSWLQHLQWGIPNVYWLNAFGPRYIEKIGRDVLTSAPGASMSVEDDLIIIESSPVDELGTPAAAASCERIRQHIGTKFFM